MHIVKFLVLGLFLAICLTACATTSAREKAKVHCPACGAELDALYQKHF